METLQMSRRHLPRWVHASIKDYIKKNYAGGPIQFEGEDDRNSEVPFWTEVRIDGPSLVTLGTRGEYLGVVEVNLLITCKKDEKYVHLFQDKIGAGLEILKARCIPIRKIGSADTSIDDGTNFTFLQLLDDEPMPVNNFGQIDKTLRQQQASLEAHYKMQLELED